LRKVDDPPSHGHLHRAGVFIGEGTRGRSTSSVVDRLIQQAVLQVLQERWDPTFSEHGYGFRPGRSAHQAVAQAQCYVAEGYNFVVDLDL
jgi:RNA-directed DNA polymerase